MNDAILYFADKINGKTKYPFIRMVFNAIFLLSITNFILIRSHPSLTLPNPTNYREVVTFCVTGHFFIPFSIFMLVLLVTQGLSELIFFWLGDFKNHKLTKKILAFQIEKNDLFGGLKGIEEASKLFDFVDLGKEKIYELFLILKPTFNKRNLDKALDTLDKSKEAISLNFTTSVRGLIALIIYFGTIEIFGIGLFVFVVVVVLACLVLLVIANKLLTILPHIMSKALEAERIYLDHVNEMGGRKNYIGNK